MAASATLSATIKEIKQSSASLSRLNNFFAKYPPSQYSVLVTRQAIPTTKQRVATGMKPLSSTSLGKSKSVPISIPTPASIPVADAQGTATNMATESEFSDMIPRPQASETSTAIQSFPPNPFLPYRNPETGRWRGARIGLRQQADLCRYAREYGVEELLPPSVKSSDYKQRRALERGLAVKGTGEGQHVKGHKWERTMAGTLEKRRQAMEAMPELIRDWEQKGHGRGWKKYPSK